MVKSLFKLVADTCILSTTENSETSSAKSLSFVVRPSDRSFIKIKNNFGPRIDPFGTPVSMLDHEDSRPISTTFWFLSFKKSVRVLQRLPDVPFCFNFKIRPLCHTLSKALDIFNNIDRTSLTLSKDL